MDAADLYGLPLDRFVPERTALAKALRGDGERDEAARVAKLAKPSVAAWAVNQLVRTQRREMADLFEAGDALRGAQEDVVGGHGNARALREAGEHERAAVSVLLERARGLLGSEGQALSQVMLDRVSDTLHAAALEPDARAEVQDGCLVHELQHVGLGGFAFGATPAPTKSTAAPKRKAAPKRDAESDAAAEAERAEEAARQRERRLDDARKAEAKARRLVDRTVRELDTAQARLERAAEALREAEEGVEAAKGRAAEAAGALDAARTELDELGG